MTADERLYISYEAVPHAAPVVLLRARIQAGGQREYAVDIKGDDGSPVSEDDLFRFVLYYYAYALYALARNGHSVRDLPAAVEKYATAAVDGRADTFALTGIRGSLVAEVPDVVAEARVLFRRIGYRDFDIAGDMPLSGATLICSVLAVVQAVVQRVSPEVVDAIRAGLANMNVSYVVLHHYNDPASCHEVPALAYCAAAFI